MLGYTMPLVTNIRLLRFLFNTADKRTKIK